jgi:ribose transport system substrate-binding protein
VNTLYGGPIDTDAQKQIQEIEALLSKGIDGLVVAPCDSAALAPVINKAVDKGIMVVTYLNDVPASKRIAYVTSELEDASLKVGRHVILQTNSPAKAIIVYAEPSNLEQQGRRRGFEMLTNEFRNLQIVAVVSDKFDAAVATEQMRPLLAKYPDVAYVFGCGSRSAVGTVAALQEMNFKPGQVTVTGWDYDEDELNLIKQGWVKVAAAQNTSYMTQIAFNILEANVGGYLYPINHPFKEHGVRALPEKIVVPVALVTQSNLEGYMPRK